MRGTIDIDPLLCKGCGVCVAFCPKGLIAIDESRLGPAGLHPAVLHDPKVDCTGCELCALMCPEAAITVRRAARP